MSFKIFIFFAITLIAGLWYETLTSSPVQAQSNGGNQGVFAQSVSETGSGMAMTVHAGSIPVQWTLQNQGDGGSGAVTAWLYPVLYPNGPLGTVAVTLTSTGANSPSTSFGPQASWGMAVSYGMASATTAQFNVNAR